jgi:hypothetical protein
MGFLADDVTDIKKRMDELAAERAKSVGTDGSAAGVKIDKPAAAPTEQQPVPSYYYP